MISEDDILKANTFLKEVDGNIEEAALLMGVKTEELEDLIDESPVLKSMYGKDRKAIPYDDAKKAARQLPPALTNPPSVRIAEALVTQENQLSVPLTNLGFSPTEAKDIVSIEEFAGQHFDRSLAILHGGMVKTAMRLIFQASEIEKKYLQDPSLEQKDRDSWWEIYFRILENIRKQNDQAQKAALTRAMIKSQKQNKGKPGFQSGVPSVAIQVNNPSSMSVSHPNDPR